MSPEAAAALPVRHGENGFICETAEQFGETCVQLLEDERLQARIGNTARADLLTEYTSQQLGERMVDMFTIAVHHHRNRDHAR